MFEKSVEIEEDVEKVYRITEDLRRGQVLTHGEISQVLGLLPHEGRWDTIMNRVRNRLREERGIETWPDYMVGYKLLTELEQIQSRFWRKKKAGRQLRKGRKAVQALPEAGLSLHMRRLRAFELDRAKKDVQEHQAQMRLEKDSFRPTPTLPRRPPSIESGNQPRCGEAR